MRRLLATLLLCALLPAREAARVAGAAQRAHARPVPAHDAHRDAHRDAHTLSAAPPAVNCVASATPLPGGPQVEVRVTPSHGDTKNGRTFLLSLPARTPATGYPLVVPLHGGVQSAGGFLYDYKIDTKSLAAGFAVATPQSLISRVCNCSYWSHTMTRRDMGAPLEYIAMAGQSANEQEEVGFFWAMYSCVKHTLRIPLSGDVYSAGYSQGSKVVTLFGCAVPPPALASTGFRVRGIMSMGAIEADPGEYPACARGTPPPLLIVQAQEDLSTPLCRDTPVYGKGEIHLLTWAQRYNRCASGKGSLPVAARALCGAPYTAVSGAFHAKRIYLFQGCAAPLAMLLTSDSLSLTGHAWPRPLPELGGRDGTDIMVEFFTAVARGAHDADTAFGEALQLKALHACEAAWPCDPKELREMDTQHVPMFIKNWSNKTSWSNTVG